MKNTNSGFRRILRGIGHFFDCFPVLDGLFTIVSVVISLLSL